MSFHVGQKFGEYSITAVLEAGSKGQLYKVEHQLTKRTEAMKVLAAEAASENQIKRFEREMRILARLSHPNIATLHNALLAENQLILFIELVEGQTLESMFSSGRVSRDAGIGYIKQILLALQYAHHQGVVHRDVTPANVIVTAAGEIKLTDFGVSKSYGDSLLTNCGEILGALPYMAPEQLKGTTQPDNRSDLYSVGAILYEYLTGQKPFGPNRSLAAVLTDSEGEPVTPSQLEPALSAKWDGIIRRALAREPSHRYQSAEEFLGALAQGDEKDQEEFVLPPMHPLSFVGAILVGLTFALFAWPSIGNFLAPASLPARLLHIPPPAFATLVPMARREPTPSAKPAVVKAEQYGSKRGDSVIARKDPPIASPASRGGAGASARTESVPGAEPAEKSSAAPDRTDVSTPAPASEKKKTFWSKLNIFKKRSSAPEDK